MELFLIKVLGDALAPDPIDVVTNNVPLVGLLAVVVAAGVFAIKFLFKKKK
ncbi:MAG: hypothetical protein IKE93_08625 [Erysipelotrichaceae bacterium]|nr:hypothetical protein [Erysipelotrichaceae bacterium]MBR2546211.1 hypothetical protein [Erysipelotrichaceae bacterium]MBR2702507.1 hypothetical protein [Erysipelotrichaceae bacterium]